MRIYVASSWRNALQPSIVRALRLLGHDVYDFRSPPGRTDFDWEQISADWKTWTPTQYRKALNHPLAIAGYSSDMQALGSCDACVLVLPSGRSASWEFGCAYGLCKKCYVVMFEACEPELMYREAKILVSMDELREEFR